MFQVGLTGGIASGKSTVSALLADHGAVVVDADLIAREVVEPGTPALAAIRERFGSGVIRADGSLNREALAEVVFSDSAANADLRAITYPEIARVIGERVGAQAETDNIVVIDAALLVESGWQGLEKLIVVAADPAVQVERMVVDRAMTRDEAAARIAAQAPLAEKLDKADIVVWNNGTRDDLSTRVDEVWDELQGARESSG